MAGENLVQIEFAAEDNASATFAKVNGELASVQATAAESNARWRKETGLSEQATIGLNKPMAELRQHVGKTAADFKPATQAMRDASVAVEELGTKGKSGMGAFRGAMRAVRVDIFEVVAALGIMLKALDEAGKAEAAQRHLSNQGVSNVSAIKLESAAGAENFEPKDYYEAATSLKVAGVASSDLVNDVTELGKASRISGVPLKELYDTAASMTEEFEMGGVPSLTQMNTLTLASSGATQGLADDYRQLAQTLKLSEQEWKVQEEAQSRSHKMMEEQSSAADSFAGKIGLSAKVFQAFQNRASYMPGMDEGMMSGELTKQYSEGLQQLSKDSGMNTEKIREYMKAGKIGYEDLISASSRYRAHQQEELEFTQKQRDEHLRLDTEAKQRALGLAALKSVMTESAWKDQAAALQTASPEGVQQVMMAQLASAMVELGKIIVQWFPEIKIAMMFLAGVEIASRIAAVNARFFPNAFKAGGAAAAQGAGGAAGAAAGGIPWAAAAADVVIPLLMTGDSSSKGKRWSQSEGRWLSEAEQNYGTDFAKHTAAKVQTLGNSPPPASPAGSGGPTEVEDPKMHDLIGRLLQVFAT